MRREQRRRSDPKSARWYKEKQSFLSRRQKALLRENFPALGIVLRYGEPLDPQQLLLPVPVPLTPTTQGTLQRRPVILDVGFGLGDSLMHLARTRPDCLVLGVEIYQAAVAQAIDKILASAAPSSSSPPSAPPSAPSPSTSSTSSTSSSSSAPPSADSSSSSGGGGINNVRLIRGDLLLLLQQNLIDASLDDVYVCFPDPWYSDQDRRVLRPETVALLERKLRPGGRLRLATDVAEMAAWVEALIQGRPAGTWMPTMRVESAPLEGPGDRARTLYEAKAVELGHRVWDLEWRRL